MYVTSSMQKTEENFTNLIQTQTSEARVFNPIECGVQGRSPFGGSGRPSRPQKKMFSQMKKFIDNFFSKFQKCSSLMEDAECAETNEK